MQVHLIDGTYELFRYFYSPGGGHQNAAGEEVGATRGVLRSMLSLLDEGATHVGIATDHVIESFRNDLWPTYKTGEGIDPLLKAQFQLLEDVLEAAGFAVFAMVDYEADDALASAAAVASADDSVDSVIICTPDKDLAQCVAMPKVIQYDRRAGQFRDTAEVIEKYGVEPASIPDWLALVGDSADGFPGLPGWGAKSAATVLAHYRHIDAIPTAAGQWEITVRGGAKLAKALQDHLDEALLFRRLATLETDAEVGKVEDWRWRGTGDAFEEMCARLDAPDALAKASRLSADRA